MYSKIQHPGLFNFPWLKKFKGACKEIEQNPNYQPDITDNELLALVVDEKGNSKHFPYKSAIAIQPMDFVPLSTERNSLGALYQIKIAGFTSNYHWRVKTPFAIFVSKQGDISLHWHEEVLKGNLASPATNFPINNLLYAECLHDSKINRVALQNNNF